MDAVGVRRVVVGLLLGVVAGEKQVLTLAIRMAGGRVERVVTDLTGALARFGDGVEPLVLDARGRGGDRGVEGGGEWRNRGNLEFRV